MVKKLCIVHGWEGRPYEPMHRWLKNKGEENEIKVFVPEMPNPLMPEIDSWNNKLKEIIEVPNEKTYFIGHSLGCQSILRYLSTLSSNIKIGGVVLIAPWMYLDKKISSKEGKEFNATARLWEETPMDWNKIKEHTSNFVCIFSDNDPYIPLSNKKLFEKKLSAKTIVEHKKGHYKYSDGTRKNTTAFNEILMMIEKNLITQSLKKS